MKRLLCATVALSLILLLSSCPKKAESDTYTMFGMEFTSQIECWEECLCVNLEDLTDSNIKTICSKEDSDGNTLIIQYIDLEGAGEEFYSLNIENSSNWKSLPYTQEMDELFAQNGVYEQYGFELIEDGYFTVSGVRTDGAGFDFDLNNFEFWRTYQIGVWDRYDECLYYISVELQS